MFSSQSKGSKTSSFTTATQIQQSDSSYNIMSSRSSFDSCKEQSIIQQGNNEANSTVLTQNKSSMSIEENHNNKSFTNSIKEKLSISRKKNRNRIFAGNIYTQSLYDDGTHLIYPPPQNQTGERDQYGFLKNTQWITDDIFNEFESYYAPIRKRRSLKWQQLLDSNNNKLPEKSKKIQRYIRKGVPPELRGEVWLHYSGAKKMMEGNKAVYYELVQHAEKLGDQNTYLEIIEGDLHRTFPENDKFQPANNEIQNTALPLCKEKNSNILIIQSLRRLLLAFSVYCPVIGYCQSLNFIAGMLLLFMNEEEAFWTFVVLVTQILPPNVYDATMEGANIDQEVLMCFISERCPQIWNKMSPGKSFWECEQEYAGMPIYTLLTNHWFLTLFINILPIESVLRVWDCLFYDGPKVLFRVALALFKLNENEILSVNDPIVVFQVIQNMPKCAIDCNKLIDATYSQYALTTRVSDEEINQRRELFRKRRTERNKNIPVQKNGKLKKTNLRSTVVHKAKEARYFVERAKSITK